MTTALEIVNSLLEATPRANASLVVFGLDAPEDGWLFTGADPFGDFINAERPGAAELRRAPDRNKYINFFVSQGYILVFKMGGAFKIYAGRNLHIPQSGVATLEKSLGLTRNTPIEYDGKTELAAKVIYGVPNKALKPAAPTGPGAIATAKGLLLKATFRGLSAPEGYFEPGSKVNAKAAQQGLRMGMAFVIKYPTGGYSVITPTGFKFTPQEIKALEGQMGLTPRKLVRWFQNNVTTYKDVAASVAIYGGAAPAPAPAPAPTPAPGAPKTP